MNIIGINRKAAMRLLVAVALGIEMIASIPVETVLQKQITDGTLLNYNGPDNSAVSTDQSRYNKSHSVGKENDYFDIFPLDKINSGNKEPDGGVRPNKDFSLELNDFGVKPEQNSDIDIGGPSPFSNKLTSLGSSKKPAAPRFMLDIFNLFDRDRSMQPSSNIIRSFTNKATLRDQTMYKNRNSDWIMCSQNLQCIKKQLLLFNLSSIPLHERIATAELRLYISLKNQRTSDAITVKTNIVRVDCIDVTNNGDPAMQQRFCVGNELTNTIVDTKHTDLTESRWEAFYITSTLQHWIKHKSGLCQLEIHTEMKQSELSQVEIDPDPGSDNEPMLIVFSDDKSHNRHNERKEEIRQLVNHQKVDAVGEGVNPSDDFSLEKRRRRFVDQNDKDTGDTEDTNIYDRSNISNVRLKRSSGGEITACHKEEMYVNFRDIDFDWIINPDGYHAYKCVGVCSYPLTGHTTTHAVLQEAMNRNFPHLHKKPCCVPTKLGPISVLYNNDGDVVYNYKYEGMQVTECGCR